MRLRNFLNENQKPRHGCALFFCLSPVAMVLHVVAVSAAPKVPTLCLDTEKIPFSCQSGKKIISICATDLSRYGGSVQYRFGSKGMPEIRVPLEAENWRKYADSATIALTGGGASYAEFWNPPYRYTVYSALIRGEGSKYGVAVKKDGILIGHFSCTTKPISDLGPDLFQEGGFPEAEDPYDFVVP